MTGMWWWSEKMLSTNFKKIPSFRRVVWSYYRAHGRHELPWRKTKDPYKVLVSEIMLQQTQVSRVTEKYKSFLKKFPTAQILGNEPLASVLKEWSGLGYNRRAKYLQDATRILAQKKKLTAGDFDKLPGVGPYTKAAVRVFAFNERDVLIETNIRTVFIHHFYARAHNITDKELRPLIEKAAEGQDPRTWHWALMDYGAHLKKSGAKNNYRSAHYTRQSKFEGSLRQVRGEILRRLNEGRPLFTAGKNGEEIERWDLALSGLERDGLIKKDRRKWLIA